MMKVLLAAETSRISAGAIRVLRTLRLPRGSDLYLLHVNPIPQKLTGLVKERILKISQHVKKIEKDVSEQARQFLGTVEQRLRGHQDVYFHSLVRKGFPGEEIVKAITYVYSLYKSEQAGNWMRGIGVFPLNRNGI
jgi:nucleotide-binding universal stress UspA family protein